METIYKVMALVDGEWFVRWSRRSRAEAEEIAALDHKLFGWTMQVVEE